MSETVIVMGVSGRAVFDAPRGGKPIEEGKPRRVQKTPWIASRIDCGDLAEVSADAYADTQKRIARRENADKGAPAQSAAKNANAASADKKDK